MTGAVPALTPSRLTWLLIAATSAAAAQPTGVLHDLELHIEPAQRRLTVTDRVHLQQGGELELGLAAGLEVSSALAGGRRLALSGTAPQQRVRVDGSGPVVLELRYGGTLPSLAEWAGGAFVDTDGVYLPAGSGWLPRAGGEWISYRLRVTVPSEYRAVATGELLEESEARGAFSASFRGTHPGEGPSVFAGHYAMREQTSGGVRVRAYFDPPLIDLAPAYLDAASRYISRYTELIGAYPFADFHVIAAPVPVGLGFPNLTYVSRRVLPAPYMRGRSLAHEVLHNWWGNGVYVDYARGNWSEGLTTYLADHGLAGRDDPAAARRLRLGWLRDFNALPNARDVPVVAFRSKSHDASQVIGYNKVAFVFHMLRAEIGRDAFESALQWFWRQYRFRLAGWPELADAFARTSGLDLEWFFRQWLERPGAPRLRLGSVARLEGNDGDHALHLSLSQQAPPYRLRVPLDVATPSGTERHVVEMRDVTWSGSIALSARAEGVVVDPDHDVFRYLAPGEAPPILRDVTLSSDSACVIATRDEAAAAAARALAERLMDTAASCSDEPPALDPDTPLLLVGTRGEVARVSPRFGLGPVPARLAGRGSAAVWTERAGDRIALIVSAGNAEGLAALAGPLPHYGGQSYLAFDGGTALVKGTWERGENEMARRLP